MVKNLEPKGAEPKRTRTDYGKLITDDYECKKDCRNCPFPGAKCYRDKYDKYDTRLLYRQ